jgi:hypothetical protein
MDNRLLSLGLKRFAYGLCCGRLLTPDDISQMPLRPESCDWDGSKKRTMGRLNGTETGYHRSNFTSSNYVCELLLRLSEII